MKQLMTFTAALLLAMGLAAVPASAHDSMNPCNPCGMHHKMNPCGMKDKMEHGMKEHGMNPCGMHHKMNPCGMKDKMEHGMNPCGMHHKMNPCNPCSMK